jgi:hypothetical protein
MLRSNLGVLLAGCAAIAVGVVGGWTALALMSTKAPLIEPTETISTQDPSVRAPSPIGAEERPAVPPPVSFTATGVHHGKAGSGLGPNRRLDRSYWSRSRRDLRMRRRPLRPHCLAKGCRQQERLRYTSNRERQTHLLRHMGRWLDLRSGEERPLQRRTQANRLGQIAGCWLHGQQTIQRNVRLEATHR